MVAGEALAGWVAAARELGCAMIFDEFYSHFLYSDLLYSDLREAVGTLSAVRHVEDVDRDPVLIVDGLTKNWRYPGLRLSWTLGRAHLIEAIASAGSFLDGGAPHPTQEAAVELLEPQRADREARSIQAAFTEKRRLMIERVRAMGLRLEHEPRGGFYCYVSLEKLPEPLRDGSAFFEAALERSVITVSGRFFVVNPGQRRSHLPSRLKHTVRLSYGPSLAEVERGLDRLAALCDDARAGRLAGEAVQEAGR